MFNKLLKRQQQSKTPILVYDGEKVAIAYAGYEYDKVMSETKLLFRVTNKTKYELTIKMDIIKIGDSTADMYCRADIFPNTWGKLKAWVDGRVELDELTANFVIRCAETCLFETIRVKGVSLK